MQPYRTRNDMALRAELLEQRQRKQHKQSGCAAHLVNTVIWLLIVGMVLLAFAVAGPDALVSYGIVSPETMAALLHLATPAPTNAQGTPLPTIDPPAPPPPAPPPAQPPAPIIIVATPAVVEEVATPTSTPTLQPRAEELAPGQFWTDEELAQFATQDAMTREAFYSDIPTAPPTFVADVRNKCGDVELYEQSPLLKSWCDVAATAEAGQ